MAHDVFLSYAKEDRNIADAVCARLEARGVRCWYAPRNVLPGANWSASIIDAIDGARIMVLVFSSHSNGSVHVRNEIERAVDKRLHIIPFRIEDITPGKELELFLSSPHWLNAITRPIEAHIDRLGETIRVVLDHLEGREAEPAVPAARPRARKRWPAAVALLVLLAAIGTAAFFVLWPGPEARDVAKQLPGPDATRREATKPAPGEEAPAPVMEQPRVEPEQPTALQTAEAALRRWDEAWQGRPDPMDTALRGDVNRLNKEIAKARDAFGRREYAHVGPVIDSALPTLEALKKRHEQGHQAALQARTDWETYVATLPEGFALPRSATSRAEATDRSFAKADFRGVVKAYDAAKRYTEAELEKWRALMAFVDSEWVGQVQPEGDRAWDMEIHFTAVQDGKLHGTMRIDFRKTGTPRRFTATLKRNRVKMTWDDPGSRRKAVFDGTIVGDTMTGDYRNWRPGRGKFEVKRR